MLSNHLILCHPLLLLPSIFPSIRVFSNELALCIRWPKDWSFTFQHQSFQWIFRTDFLWDELVWFSCSPRDSQESSTPQLKSINSSAFTFLYGPTLTSAHDYWKNHSFYTDLSWQCLCFLIHCLGLFVIAFLPRSKCLLISWLQSPICSGFGAQENKVCHCFPILSWPVSNYCWQFVGSSFLCIFLNLCHARYVILASFLPWLYVESFLSH